MKTARRKRKRENLKRKVKNLSNSADKAVGLTRFLGKSLPPSRVSFILIIVASFLFGVLAQFAAGSSAYDGIRAVFIIAVPALLGAVACISIKRRIRYRQIMFLALVSSLIYGIFYLLHFGGIIARFSTEQLSFNALLLGNALIFILWYVVARIVFNLKYSSFLFGLITPTLNAIFLLADKSLSVGSAESVSLLMKLYFSTFIFMAAVYALFWLINAPMKRNFGVSLTDAASLFLAQWFDSSPKLERMFEEVGEEITSLLGVVAFKSSGKLKAVFVIPHVHYGPFGTLGGSKFPEIIAEEVKKRIGVEAFVFHGCATHDFNPVAKDEVEKFYSKLFPSLEQAKFEPAKGWVAIGKAGPSKCFGVMLNGVLFAPMTRAPRTTEDIDFSVGLAIRGAALSKGAKEALVLDAHNCETGEITKVESGNPITFEHMAAIEDALKRGNEIGVGPIRAGFASDAPMSVFAATTVGAAGAKAAVFETDSGKKRFVFIIFDSNGITPDFRREMIDSVCSLGFDECEIMTTDTHGVNKVAGVLNPLGAKSSERNVVLSRTIELVKKAYKDVSDVESFGELIPVEGVKIFGVAQSSELLGTINSVVAVVRVAAPLVLVGATAAALWAMTKI